MHDFFITLFSCMVVFINLEFDMGLHYLAIIERNLENKTKLTSVWIMNSVGLNSIFLWRVIVFSVMLLLWIVFPKNYIGMEFFLLIVPGWIVILVNNARLITPPKISKCQPEYMNSKQIFLLCSGSHRVYWRIPRSWNRPTWLNNVLLPHTYSKFVQLFC